MNQQFSEWLFDPFVGKIITALLSIIFVIVFVKFIQKILNRRIKDKDTKYRGRKFVNILGYVLSILILSIVFSDKLGGLTVALGVAGAGIAFALQEVIASIAGWVAISFARFYKTGDRVQLGGIRGDVIDIGMLRTTIMEVGDWVNGDLYNGRVVRVANSFIFKEPVFNYSGDFPFLWDEIQIPVRHGSDAKIARKILEDIGNEIVGDYSQKAKESWKDLTNKFLIEDAKIEPMVSLVADENWMTFTLRYVVEYKKRRTIKDLLFSRVLEEFEKSAKNVSIASAAQEITLINPK